MATLKKPVLLCILDGWGIDENGKYNAIKEAKTPNFDKIMKEYPNALLEASGEFVGLPAGQIGNSEVGHTNIGAGRVVFQDLPKINKAVKEDTLKDNTKIVKLIKTLKENGKDCHILGLLSDGGVHSHQNHIAALCKIIASEGINVKVHAFLDGRDVAQKSAKGYVLKFEQDTRDFDNIQIASIGGRYYGMDRDKRWDRVAGAYNVIVNGVHGASVASDALSVVDSAYKEDKTDEFVIPFALEGYEGMQDGDACLIANFRADRVRQISEALFNPNFDGFNRNKFVNFSEKMGMVEYSAHLTNFMDTVFAPEEIKNSLGEVVSEAGLKQLRIAETEKYAHVTFFFNGGAEDEFEGEDRMLVSSPDVATYDLQPEMSAEELTGKLLDAMKSDKYDLIVVNYANPDMVGHTGIMDAAIKACETVDTKLGQLVDFAKENDWNMLVTADHGNAEKMFDDTNGQPYTAHTTSKVPLVFVSNDTSSVKVKDGSLCDIAPSILKLAGLDKPEEMTGKNLIARSVSISL